MTPLEEATLRQEIAEARFKHTTVELFKCFITGDEWYPKLSADRYDASTEAKQVLLDNHLQDMLHKAKSAAKLLIDGGYFNG